MKISLNWLREYLDVDLEPAKIGELLTSIGLEVEGMEEVETLPGGMRGVVVGEVVECDRHPNADRLSLTRVDIGAGEPLQIVCGAPNVAAGQKVLVATIGTTLYPTEGEPFTLKKGKIRGEASEGMICAEDELGLGHDHSGIIVLPETATVGQAAADYYGLENDFVYEIGLTPNRSDATNHLGVARDLAAVLRVHHGHSGKVKMPEVSAFKVDNHELPVEVEVRNTEACPRYSGVTIKGVQVGESPDWLKRRLLSVGVRPINNIVDVTNFVLHEMGQPLHAFDLDRIGESKVIVETLAADTVFKTLDEVDRRLLATDLMICDGRDQGMCIAGVFGGIGSGVTEGTTNIFLESAHFDPLYVRRSSMHHNLRTDAARIFEKGSDPNITVYALKRAALLIQSLAGGEIADDVVDIYPSPIEPVKIRVRYGRINHLIGIEVLPAQVHAILEAMGMEISDRDDEAFTVAVPTNKSDVTREIDIIEEVLRIYGFNNVPIPSRVTTSMALAPDPDPTAMRELIGNLLAARGFHEMMALSLSESRYYTEESPVAAEALVYVNNTANVHLDIMRPTMLYGGLEAIVRNQNRQESDLALFEFGRTYRAEGEGYKEVDHLALFLTGRRRPENWLSGGEENVSYYTLQSHVQSILDRLGISGYQAVPVEDDTFAYGLTYQRGQKSLVSFGQLHPRPCRKMDIRGEVFHADFDWNAVLRALPRKRVAFRELNRFPSVRRDLALVVEKSVKFSDIASIATKVGKPLLRETNLFDVYTNEEQLGAGKKSYAVSFLFEDPGKTLQDREVDQVMNRLIEQFETQLGAQIRR